MSLKLTCQYPKCIGENAVILYRYEKGTQSKKQYCQTHFDRMRIAEAPAPKWLSSLGRARNPK